LYCTARTASRSPPTWPLVLWIISIWSSILLEKSLARAMSAGTDCFPTAHCSFFCDAWHMRILMDRCAMAISAAMLIRSPTMASGIHKVRVVRYGDVPPQVLSRSLPRTVGRVVVRLPSCPLRPGFSVGVLGRVEMSPSSGVWSICGLPTSRVDVQPMDLLPPVDHLWCYVHFILVDGLGRESPTSLASDLGSRRPCISKLSHSAGGTFLWVCRSLTMLCARVSGGSLPGICWDALAIESLLMRCSVCSVVSVLAHEVLRWAAVALP
jgi:hypothetical protein